MMDQFHLNLHKSDVRAHTRSSCTIAVDFRVSSTRSRAASLNSGRLRHDKLMFAQRPQITKRGAFTFCFCTKNRVYMWSERAVFANNFWACSHVCNINYAVVVHQMLPRCVFGRFLVWSPGPEEQLSLQEKIKLIVLSRCTRDTWIWEISNQNE